MKYILVLILWVSFLIPTTAQNLSEAEVCETMNRAFALNKQKKHKEALDAFLVVGQNTEGKRTEAERQTYVMSQTMACRCYELTGGYEKGYLLARKLLSGKITDQERKEILHLYVMNGYLYSCQFIKGNDCDYAKARTLLEEILPYVDDTTEKYVRPKIPLTWYKEGMLAEIQQQYDKALPCMEKAAEGYRQLGYTKEELKAVSEIANMRNMLNNTVEALDAYRYARTLAQKTGNNSLLLSTLMEEKKLNVTLGDMEEVGRVVQAMDSLAEADDSPQMRYLYNTFKGDVAREQGNLDLALLWYKKNLGYVSQEGTNKSERYSYYVKLRDLHSANRQYEETLHYARLCVKEMQSQSALTKAGYYLPYIAIVDIYQRMGEKEKCMAALDTLFKSKEFIVEPREMQQLYVIRARCYATFGEYDKALTDYKLLDSILATKYGEDDGDRVVLLALMGGMEHRLKHYEESERLYTLYAERIKKLYGEDSDEYVAALSYQANAEAFAGHIDKGCGHYGEAVDMFKIRMRKRLPYLTAAERDGYWQGISSMLTNMPPFALKAGRTQTGFTRTCYDALVMSKAFLLESDRSAFDIIKRSGTSKDMRDFATMQSLSLKMKEWEKDYQHYADSITATSARIENINRQLATNCRRYDDMTTFMDVDYETVKTALDKNEMLIDFTDYMSEKDGRKYAAFIINKTQDYPLLKYLFAERSIDSLQIARPDYFYEEPYASEIRRMLWQPFEESVQEGMTIYYVPSQLFFQISLESIPLEDGTLLGNHYHFVRLSSARELVRFRQQLAISEKSSAVLYGGLQYDVEPTLMAMEAKKYNISSLFAMRGGDITRGDTIFMDLPETKKEVDAIGSILRGKGLNVQTFTGMNGTEESFLNMNGKAPQILQLATHGFYYMPDQAMRINYLQGYKDAMQLSGLVMSGGNAAWRGKELPQGVLGGILTANDIATLDLSGMEMVVLSACQTGQGKATAEGLYGLQRAFKKAGAKTLVMTLWNINDAICREFMVSFYEQLTANNWNKHNAFEEAKKAIRKKYPEAFYWAGFVMLD